MIPLYLCEKPAQARDIARHVGAHQKQDGFLTGNQATVTWCFGHLVEMAPPETYCELVKPWRLSNLPIIPRDWKLLVKESCKKQFQVIANCLKKTSHVIIATDPDREGELISREILALCQFKGTIERLWLSALDDASIQKALQNRRKGSSTEPLYQAGLARQRCDWLIGMNLTMAASCCFGAQGEGVISVGRVQTPTLKLVVDRDQAIDNFQPKTYLELHAQFTDANHQSFWCQWQPKENDQDEEGYCVLLEKVETIQKKIQNQNAFVQHFAEEVKHQSPPLCLSLSELQKRCSSRYGFSAQDTLNYAQALYETHKATTYPRTDCGYLPESQWAEAPEVLMALRKIDPLLTDLLANTDSSSKSPVWNDKKITAHHGIIPTLNDQVNWQVMSKEEQKVYDLIRRHYIAQFLGDYEYALRSLTVLCEAETFKATSHTPLKTGWKFAFKNELEEEGVENDNPLPLLTNQQGLQHTESKILTKQTKPLPRFTEGTLIDAMKSIGKQVHDPVYKKILKDTAGIGTEATRAAMIEILFKRGYVEKKGKHLQATEKGRKLIQLLPPTLCHPELTAQWEQALEEIAEGKCELTTFMQHQEALLRSMLAVLEEAPTNNQNSSTFLCRECGKPLQQRYSKKNQQHFWGCQGYPECAVTFPDGNGVPDFSKKKMNTTHQYPSNTKKNSVKKSVATQTNNKNNKK